MTEVKPTLRGYCQKLGFCIAACHCCGLLPVMPCLWRWSMSLVSLLGTSALYHRVDWSPVWHARMRRLITGWSASAKLCSWCWWTAQRSHHAAAVVLGGAGFHSQCGVADLSQMGALQHLRHAGWSVSLAAPQLLQKLGPTPTALMLGTHPIRGALFYASRRPNCARYFWHASFMLSCS